MESTQGGLSILGNAVCAAGAVAFIGGVYSDMDRYGLYMLYLSLYPACYGMM
jgi:hypothetical protein